MASKLSPVGAEVDDQSMTRAAGSPTARSAMSARAGPRPGIFCVRVFGSKGLMHYEIDFGTWDTPDQLHKTSTLYIQRGKDGYGKREELHAAGERHVPRRARDVRGELPQRQSRTSSAPTTATSRWRWSTRRCARSSSKGQAVQHRRRDRRGARGALARKEAAMLPSRYFTDLTQPEIAAQLKKNPLVILPAGSVEQHGPHLPTGTDTLAANVIGARGRRAHGRPGAAGDAARRHADAHAVRGHDHAHARHLHAGA